MHIFQKYYKDVTAFRYLLITINMMNPLKLLRYVELNINHEIIDYNTELNYEVIEELASILPEPIGDPSIVPTYLNKQVLKRQNCSKWRWC